MTLEQSTEGSLASLIEKCTVYLSPEDLKTIERAYVFAEVAHQDQSRHSGIPYITHPVLVASILAELRQDVATICAGLLHDTIEDTVVDQKGLTKEFGADVCQLVSGVTKLGKIYFGSKEEQQAENFRKLFLAMANDVRVVIIKLADRLHNMRTLKSLPQHKQERIAIETREIFAPLAHRMGIWSLKWELEDLCFFYLEPNEFQEIKRLVASHRSTREQYLLGFINHMQTLCDDLKIPVKISGRPKHFYSIYQKLKKQHIAFEDLYDTLGVRIMVNTVGDCYQVLGIIHSAYKPISGRIKDYIAVPKSNMYQSLHTTVIGPEGNPVEAQIRTMEMHQVAENGIAAHWQYKGGAPQRGKQQGDFSWLREIIDLQQDVKAPRDFLQELKLDLFIDEVFVFTPLGDLYTLPKGATPIDFAYRIHTEVGHCCVGAKINGAITTLDQVLRSGDRVEILTTKQGHPKLDWLDFAKTSQSKNRIKQWFRRQATTENLQLGRKKLEKALILAGYSPKETLTANYLDKLKSHFAIERYEDLFLHIAHGDVQAREVITFLNKLRHPEGESSALKHDIPLSSKSSKSDSDDLGIRVLGEEHISVRIAKCCHPLPGDDIMGFITLGSGISVHRKDCRHMRYSIDETTKSRIIEVSWDPRKKILYPVTLSVEGFDRTGILQDILQKIADRKAAIRKVETALSPNGGGMSATIVLDIPDLAYLKRIMTALNSISDVISVRRVNHD
ncbi:MAG: bifunctional (p)ppGpp synthetase/guanosine-3',5'-bis(diphosphate) 3'-pyrophosphohydrolase [Candidatus Margulisbacteria bacterium]|nr:bifunctional (p)ppGpp synthetase/guanosine-3',5'-bis(diphosphate) 3'-pyrophosphohydrolase [Candidatus Margulisiibacteriota bacterium]